MKLENLSGKKIAVIVASGFDETGFIAIQRVMMDAGAKLKIISSEAGLVYSWNGDVWGMSYPTDAALSTTLAIDYDGLIIPGGERHIDNLQNEAHAMRVLRAFLREDMPVLLQGNAKNLLYSVDGGEEKVNSSISGADSLTCVTGRLVMTAKTNSDFPDLQAFNAVVGSMVDKSCAA